MSSVPVIFGEVLFDCFPDGREVLGGAPFNVAWHLRAFGQAPVLVSRVGTDDAGDRVRETMRGWGLDLSGLQRDDERPTGRVDIRFEDGEPSYEIDYPVAWDAIEPHRGGPGSPALLYHGSLALRDETSRSALDDLRTRSGGRVFVDVNLRPPWWRRDALLRGIDGGHWVKLNEDELAQLDDREGDIESRATAFLERHHLDGLLLTRGAAGAMALAKGATPVSSSPPPRVDVVDTVGAGDAFASVMMLGLLSEWALPLSLERALAFAAAVCGLRGGTTDDLEFYRPFIDVWNLKPEHPHDV